VSVSEYENRDAAWAEVARGVRRAVEDFRSRDQRPTSRTRLSKVGREAYETSTYIRHLLAFRQNKVSAFEALSLKAEINGRTEYLENALETWATGKFRPLFLLTGDADSATWAFRQLAATLADQVLHGHHLSPQLVYVPFHTLHNGRGIEAIYQALPEARGALDRYKEGANTVLLLDGIDQVSLNSVEAGLQMLVEVLHETQVNAGIALSCRMQVAADLLKALKKHRYQPLLGRMVEPEIDTTCYAPLYSDWPAFRRTANVRRSATLLPAEILNSWAEGPLSLTNFYSRFVRSSIQSVWQRDKTLVGVPPEIPWSFLTDLARQMFPSVSTRVSATQIGDEWGSKKLDIINGLVASGLLTIDSNESISFSHVSLFEFFFARMLFKELLSWNAEYLARSNLIYLYNVNRILVPMLLNAESAQLTDEARRTREQLQQGAIETETGWLTQPILRTDFTTFVVSTGWRLHTGFGHWTSFVGPSGSFDASDGSIIPEQRNFFSPKHSEVQNRFAVWLSWYDAYQFARWVAGSLPTSARVPPVDSSSAPELEWTSTWIDESQSLICARDIKDGSEHGVNPDVRSSRIGFRIEFTEKI
jgi:hypothetical protein